MIPGKKFMLTSTCEKLYNLLIYVNDTKQYKMNSNPCFNKYLLFAAEFLLLTTIRHSTSVDTLLLLKFSLSA